MRSNNCLAGFKPDASISGSLMCGPGGKVYYVGGNYERENKERVGFKGLITNPGESISNPTATPIHICERYLDEGCEWCEYNGDKIT